MAPQGRGESRLSGAPGAAPRGRAMVWVALLAVQVIFAVHYLAAKIVLATVPAPAWAATRVVLAAAVFLALFAVRRARRPRPPVAPGDLVRLAALSFFGVVLNQVCFTEGLARTTPAHSSLINTTIPVATIVFAVLLGRERVRVRGILGIVLAMAGVLVLLRVERLELKAEWLRGDLLTQLNAASFALFLVLSRDTIRRVGPVASTAGVLAFGAVGISFYGGSAVTRVDPATLTPTVVGLALWIVIFPTVVAYFLNYWALARVDSSRVALFVYLQPILASALSVALLGETIDARLVVSTALVFLGVFFAATDRRGGPVVVSGPPPAAEPAVRPPPPPSRGDRAGS